MAEPGFWDHQETAQKLIDETNLLKGKSESFETLTQQLSDAQVAVELLEEEPDQEVQLELETNLDHLKGELQQYRLNLLLNGPYDSHNAILEIHPVQVAPNHRTGARCYYGCILVGLININSKLKR